MCGVHGGRLVCIALDSYRNENTEIMNSSQTVLMISNTKTLAQVIDGDTYLLEMIRRPC